MVKFTAEELPMINELIKGCASKVEVVNSFESCIQNTEDAELRQMAGDSLDKIKLMSDTAINHVLENGMFVQDLQY